MWGLRSSRTAVIGTAVAAFAVLCVLPTAYMAGRLFADSGAASLAGALFLDQRQRGLLYNTAILGAGTAILATLAGAPLGVALARVALPLKPALRIALTAPLLLPPYVLALAWTYMGASTSPLARLAGHDVLSEWIYSLAGAIGVLSLVFYPLSMLATEVAVRRVEPGLEEAGLLVAAPRRVLWRITLPLAAPAVAGAALVIFVLAISEFGVPALLRVRVFTTEVFTAFAALYDFGRATVLALPLLLLSIAVAVVAAALVSDRLIATRRGSDGVRLLAFEGWRRRAAAAAIAVLVVALVVPLVVLAREAWGVPSWNAILEGSREAIVNSLVLAALGATAVTIVGALLGYARARAPGRIAVAADVVCVVLFAVPSTIVGIGLIGVWNRPGVFGAVYGTQAMLLLAYLARFIPVAALALAASVRQVPVSHEEAAAVSGAGWLPTMARIVIPQVRLGLAAAWTIAFILNFGELGASILVAPPGESTLPVRIHTIIANTPSSQVAALALLQSLVVFCPLAVLALALTARKTR